MTRVYCFFIYIFFPFTSFCQKGNSSLKITPLCADYFVFTTWHNLNGVPFPANGMYVVTDSGVIMIDSPWDTTQVEPLLDSIENRHHKKVVMCIATHYHEDRTGGFPILSRFGIQTWSSALTKLYCEKNEEPLASYIFMNDTIFKIGNITIETYYPGPAHTPDNLVIWFPDQKVLYGGCMIKSTESPVLGNLTDADTFSWPKSLENVRKKFPKPKYVIPGHQDWTSLKSIGHTQDMLKVHNAQ